MEIIDTFRKALKLQIHTPLFIFPTKKFKPLRLGRNCLSTLQFSFRHTFPPPQLWRVFFPAPNKEPGSPGRDFAARISCSLGGMREARGWLGPGTHSGACLQPGLWRRHIPVLGSLGRAGCTPWMLPLHTLRAGTKLGAQLQAASFPWHRWPCLLLWLCWSCRAAWY